MIEIAGVDRDEAAGSLRFSIDAPFVGRLDGHVVEVAGWVASQVEAVERVEICDADGMAIVAAYGVERPDVTAVFPDVPVECGYHASIKLGDGPPDIELTVVAHVAGGNRITLARIHGRHHAAPAELPTPVVLARRPSFLSETVAPVSEAISEADTMFAGHLESYLAVGGSALKAIRLAQLAAGTPEPSRVLDFGCGHGRVMRWLRAAFPDAELSATDVDHAGVEFCATRFDATALPAEAEPSAALLGTRHDLIWVGSVFTHLPVERWRSLLGILAGALAPGGLLVATHHGPLVAERLRMGWSYGYPPEAVIQGVASYDSTGFGFLAADGEYGLSVSTPSWVAGEVAAHPGLRMVSYTEALWGNHQDVLAASANPIDPELPSLPFT